jgi:single-stranded-DNA-specific exonuclease
MKIRQKGVEWILPQISQQHIEEVNRLAERWDLDPIIVHLLLQRGFSEEEFWLFQDPYGVPLHSPHQLKGIDPLIKRMAQLIQKKESVFLYGDYDVDGTTSVALFACFLEYLGVPYQKYIPHRVYEGYGLSQKGIESVLRSGARLLITFDCGIKEVEPIQMAKEHGLEVIVIDHHLSGDTLPPADIIINPHQPGCAYPFKELSAGALTYKVIQGICEALALDFPYESYLDLVCLSLICDLVPMRGENWVLAKQGLRKLNSNPSPGIAKLIELADLSFPITARDILLRIGPRLNSQGRLDSALVTVDLLMGETQYGIHLEEVNKRRREIQDRMLEEALMKISQSPHQFEHGIVLYDYAWEVGLIGILAAQLLERYQKPVVILTDGANGEIVGSARSLEPLNIHAILEELSHYFLRFGGHPQAAGFTLHPHSLTSFVDDFLKACKSYSQDITYADTIQIHIDLNIPFHRITDHLIDQLERLSPFGSGFPEPIFSTKCVRLCHFTIFNDSHVKAYFQDPDHEQREGIMYHGASQFLKLDPRKPVDIAYEIQWYYKNGERRVYLNLKDIRYSEICPKNL